MSRMPYSTAVFQDALRTLDERRQHAAQTAAALRAEAIGRFPRLREIELLLAGTGAHMAQAILSGGDIDAAVARIQNENQQLQTEMATILANGGYTVANFEPSPVCPLCGDTGYHDGQMCTCLRQLLKEKAAAAVCHGLLSAPARFADLSMQYYEDTAPNGAGMSPRQRMRSIFAYCEAYAENFTTDSPSLLLRGATGTGKTHISLAIAATVAQNGFSVLYQPAGKLFGLLEREHFGKQDGNMEEVALSCDLLVIDDLGTEFDTAFTNAMLYSIINTRLLDHLPILISTNLTQEGLQNRYGDQIVSRITGAFEPLLFVGKDIRQQKRAEAMLR